jgi:hypothetical protein
MIFLGVCEAPRLGGSVLFSAATRTYFVDLSAYPQWLVVLVGTFAAVLILWIMMKLLKWTLWLLLFAVLIGGVLWSGVLLIS